MEISAEKTKLMTNNTSGINTDQSKWTEAWDSHKLQIPGLTYDWLGFQAWDTLQDSTDDSSIDKVETSLERQEHLSQFQDITDALPCHFHLNSCVLVDHGPSQKSSKEEYKPWKWAATAKFYASHAKTKIQQAIRPHEDLLIIVKRRKLKWYEHVSRSSGLTVLLGTVKKGRRQGRQKKRWKDNIREWTGLEFAKSLRAVENREKWRKLVVKPSVVPQRPFRSRDRWRWRWINAKHIKMFTETVQDNDFRCLSHNGYTDSLLQMSPLADELPPLLVSKMASWDLTVLATC